MRNIRAETLSLPVLTIAAAKKEVLIVSEQHYFETRSLPHSARAYTYPRTGK